MDTPQTTAPAVLNPRGRETVRRLAEANGRSVAAELRIAVVAHPPGPVVKAQHPTEAARQALMTAALAEGPKWALLLTRMAESLPPRDVPPAVRPAVVRRGNVIELRPGVGA